MIEVQNLTCGYGDTTVIRDVSFSVERGRVCGLIGANGAGKSTLMKCIMGYIKPKAGDVLVSGVSIIRATEREVSKRIAYVAQSHDVAFSFSVLEMVLMGRTPYLGGMYGPKKDDYEICHKQLEQVGMASYADRNFQNLSGGQKQLVYLARAFAQDTPVLVLDEPTTGLDYKNQMVFWKMIRDAARHGKTVLVCVHDPGHVMWFCDDVVAIRNDGTLLAKGKVADVICSDLLKKVYDMNIDIVQAGAHGSVAIPHMA